MDIKEGQVLINGKLILEPYIADPETSGYVEHFKVPEGDLFVMGDNRKVSLDSRSLEVGCVRIDDVIGKAVVRLYLFLTKSGLCKLCPDMEAGDRGDRK